VGKAWPLKGGARMLQDARSWGVGDKRLFAFRVEVYGGTVQCQSCTLRS
jgi:hypothetical protein